jgi:hypothetical protein
MIALVLVVCLAAAPDICRDEQPPLAPPSLGACLAQGQIIAAQWLDEHPKYTLRGWRCRLGAPQGNA